MNLLSAPANESPGLLRWRMRWALVALALGALAIGLAPVLVRLLSVPETSVAFWRLLLALPALLLAMLFIPRQQWRPAPGQWHLWGLAGLCFALDLAVWHQSIRFTTVANATLLANLAPVFVVLIAWRLFGERVSAGFVGGMVLALGGSAVLAWAGQGSRPSALGGDALGVLTAVFYAGYILAVTRARARASTVALMFWTTAISAALLLPLALWVDGAALWPDDAREWRLLLLLALLSHALGQGLIAYAMAWLPAAFSSVSLLIQPVAAALFAALILDELLGPWQALAGALVLTGIVVCRLSRQAVPKTI